jgi:hypothetical protein
MFRPSLAVPVFCLLVASPLEAVGATKCDALARQDFPKLAAGTSVRLSAPQRVAAGQPFKLQWQRGDMQGRYPAYVMIAFDAPVRFEGKGYYALLPKASAAFGISRFADMTRVVIPLYGLGVPRAGDVTVRPLLAGPLNVRWALVGHDRCKELAAEAAQGSAAMRVEATGQPEIVVSDVLAGENPKERIFSPAGGRVIEVHDGRFRLVDEASRAEIAERAGRTPRFSPTGRFLAAYVEDGIEIIDAVDGKTVYKDGPAYHLAWDNADSFAVLDQGSNGTIAILAPVRRDPIVLDGSFGARCCGGVDSVALRIDLENNVAVAVGDSGDPGGYAVGLTVDAKGDGAIAFVKRQSQVMEFTLPKRWELRGGLKFSHVYTYQDTEFEKGAQTALRKFEVKPRLESVSSKRETGDGSLIAAQWRNVSNAGPLNVGPNLLKRLHEFGLPTAMRVSERFAREVVLLDDTDNMESVPSHRATEIGAALAGVVRRIENDMPVAREILVPRTVDGGKCGPYKEGKTYSEFQKAFRFQAPDRTLWMTHFKCADGQALFQSPSLVLLDSKSAAAWFLASDWGPDKTPSTTGDPNSNIGTGCAGNIAFCDFDAEIFGDRFLVLSSAKSRAIEVFDIDERRNIFRKYDLPRGDLLTRALLSPEGNLVLQINSDGSFAGFRFSDTRLLFEGRYVDDEVVVWTPDGRFDATSEGAHYVSLRLPGRIANYTFEQFAARLKTSGLVDKLLAGETFKPAELVSPPSLKGVMQVREGRVRGTVDATSDAALASLLIFQDGLLSDRLAAPANGKSWDIDVPLMPGTRWVSMVAVDKTGLASLPMGRDLATAQVSPRRVHVLAIGIDDYADPRIVDLALARSDARRFADAVDASGRDVVVVSRRILHEKDAKRESVLTALREVIAGSAPGETVMLFFAGHGVRSDDGDYFLATPDTRIDDIRGTALPWSDIADILTRSRARIAVFLDTCHSGAAGVGAFTTNDAAAQSLLERVPSGIVVFSASKGRELSEEMPAVGGGVFTSALVRVIASERSRFDANHNGVIEISELYRGVKAQVIANTDGRQTPWIARNQMVGDFSLF